MLSPDQFNVRLDSSASFCENPQFGRERWLPTPDIGTKVSGGGTDANDPTRKWGVALQF